MSNNTTKIIIKNKNAIETYIIRVDDEMMVYNAHSAELLDHLVIVKIDGLIDVLYKDTNTRTIMELSELEEKIEKWINDDAIFVKYKTATPFFQAQILNKNYKISTGDIMKFRRKYEHTSTFIVNNYNETTQMVELRTEKGFTHTMSVTEFQRELGQSNTFTLLDRDYFSTKLKNTAINMEILDLVL